MARRILSQQKRWFFLSMTTRICCKQLPAPLPLPVGLSTPIGPGRHFSVPMIRARLAVSYSLCAYRMCTGADVHQRSQPSADLAPDKGRKGSLIIQNKT